MSEEQNIYNPNQLGRQSNQHFFQLRDNNMQQNSESYAKEEARRVPQNLNTNHSSDENSQSFTLRRKKKKGVFNLPSKKKDFVEIVQTTDFNEDDQRFITIQPDDNNNQSDIEMSLLEIFDNRFKLEQSGLQSITSATTDTSKKAGPSVSSDNQREQTVVSDDALDEMVRSSAVPTNLQDYLLIHREIDPMHAITCLSRAQRREKILQKISKSLGSDK